MEKLIAKFQEIYPDVSAEGAEGSVLNIIESVKAGLQVAIPTGKEAQMDELLVMVKEHIEAPVEEVAEEVVDEAAADVPVDTEAEVLPAEQE